jgi:hypothetical protein
MQNALAGQLAPTREAWCSQFIELARPLFTAAGSPLPPLVRAAICPPHRAKQRYIGLCWSDAVSEDNGREIWITAAETDPVKVAGILVHELCHAALPHSEKHGKRFRLLATSLGLEGPMRATTEGDRFESLWADVLVRLGPLPGARFVAGWAVDFRKQKTPRMTNVSCGVCGFVAKVKVEQMTWGRLTCPVHGEELTTPRERGG